jgi:hypothetical protein
VTAALPPRRAYRPPLPPRRERATKPFSWLPVAVFAFALAMVLWLWQWWVYDWNVGSSILLIPLLTFLTLPIFLGASARERRFDLAGIAATGLALRFFATFYRMVHGADAFVYDKEGNRIADALRHLDFGFDPKAEVPGTGGMRVVTGVVSVFTGADRAAKFLIFAWLGFLGCWLLYRAFVTAMPDADHRRYALLLFLWPSLIYWPSSIGKDGWMLFTLGIASLGAARVLVRRPGGYTLLVIGLLVGSFVRPHVSLMALLAFGVALLIGRRVSTRPGITPSSVAKVAGLVVLVAIGGVLVSRAASVLDVDDFSSSSISTALESNVTRSAEGGAQFTAADPQNPLGYVEATVTILFRPLPFEAHSSEQVAAALEGLVLLGLFAASWRRLLTVPRHLREWPYMTYAIVYLLIFFFAFGTMSNFGILARQRSQALPFVFVLLALPAVARARRSRSRAPTARRRGTGARASAPGGWASPRS